MSLFVRSHVSGTRAWIFGALALLLPFAAAAEHDSHERREPRRGDFCLMSQAPQHHHHGPTPAQLRRYFRQVFRTAPIRHDHGSHFHCRPCERRFESRWELQRHAVRHHRASVPFLRFTLLPHGFSWVFDG